MIGFWHDTVVCPSVRPSVCLSVANCIVVTVLRVGVWVEGCAVVFL